MQINVLVRIIQAKNVGTSKDPLSDTHEEETGKHQSQQRQWSVGSITCSICDARFNVCVSNCVSRIVSTGRHKVTWAFFPGV